MRFLLMMMLLCASTSLAAQTSSARDNSAPAKTVQQLFQDDQNDLPGHGPNGTSSVDEQQYNTRVEIRKQQVRTLLTNGGLKTGEDFYDAAFIFQHGETADDYLFAHVLAMDAVVKGYDTAKWIAAATLDRYLQIIHQPQVFGTQYPLDPNKPHPTEDTTPEGRFKGRTQQSYNDMLLPDSLRTDFCVASRNQQKQVLAFMDTGKRPPGALMIAPGCKR
jgi:hypothetical protein